MSVYSQEHPQAQFPAHESDVSGNLGLIGRITERKRSALTDVSNCTVEVPPHRRARTAPSATSDKIAVQRFTLVSRDAPPAKRGPAQHGVLLAPPRVAVQLGRVVQVCRCSECDRQGLRRRASGTRLCRRDTESHPEYALLLAMTERFQTECPERGAASTLVNEACCREKSAYFILGPDTTTVGYVAAEVAANRRVTSKVADASPTVLQIYVEPEFRRRGYASEALSMLLRDHEALNIDNPSWSVLRMVERLGYTPAGTHDGADGRQMVSLIKKDMVTDF